MRFFKYFKLQLLCINQQKFSGVRSLYGRSAGKYKLSPFRHLRLKHSSGLMAKYSEILRTWNNRKGISMPFLIYVFIQE